MTTNHDIEQVWRQQPLAEADDVGRGDPRRRATDFDMKVRAMERVGGLTFALLLVKNVWEVWVDTDVRRARRRPV